ncbi:hypothetical protein ACFL5V_09945 [Fibrobacterota bacterium]
MKMTLACILFLCSIVLPEKPKAPEDLLSIHICLGELEEAYRADKWREAQSQLIKVRRVYADLLKPLLKAVPKDTVSLFGKIGAGLDKSLKAKDKEKTETNMLELNGIFLVFMQYFSHERPPVLVFIEAQCDEVKKASGEALKAEIQELEHYAGALTGVLSQSEIEQYKKLVAGLKSGDKSKAKEIRKLVSKKK